MLPPKNAFLIYATYRRSSAKTLHFAPISLISTNQGLISSAVIIVENGHPWGMDVNDWWASPTFSPNWKCVAEASK